MNVRANMCVQAAQRKWGEGWKPLSPEMREAFVSRELFLLALGQDEDTRKQFPSVVSENLLEDFRQALGGVE